AQRLAQHDVDRAGDGPRAGLGGGSAVDLDALDLVRRQGLDREPARHALAVDEDLRVAVAHAAHAHPAAPARAARERHAGPSPSGESPYCSISSRPTTIFAAVDCRRSLVVSLRPVMCTRSSVVRGADAALAAGAGGCCAEASAAPRTASSTCERATESGRRR